MLIALLFACSQPLPTAPCNDGDPEAPRPLGPVEALPGRSPAARGLLNRLRAIDPSDPARFVVGQNIGHTDFRFDEHHAAYVEDLEPIGTPGILAVDYGYALDPAQLANANAALVAHAERGGWVSISTHAGNPITGGDIGDRRYDPADFGDLLVEGTEPNRRYQETLDRLADGLEELRDAGVVVLWRPMHEMNGTWFWYSTNREGTWTDQDAFVAVWRDMHRTFTEERGLDNLLWVYSPNSQMSDVVHDTMAYYPGDDVVDVVALDIYETSLESVDACGSYSKLAALDKPTGLGEVGPGRGNDNPGSSWDILRVLDVADTHERLAFGVFWHGWLGRRDEPKALVEFEDAGAFFDDPRVLDREALASEP